MKVVKGNSSPRFLFNGSLAILKNTPESTPPTDLESFEDLQTALSATGSIDLTGRSFAITQNHSSWTTGITLSNDARSITGGTVYGASPLSWTETSSGSGIYEATIPSSGLSYDEWACFLIDNSQSVPPQQHMYPAPTNGWETHPHSYNESWLRIVESSTSVLGVVTTASGDNVPNGVIQSITITDSTTANELNNLITGGSQTIPCIGMHSDANLVKFVKPQSVEFANNQLTITLQPGNTFKLANSGYFDLVLGGILNESVLSSGQYAISPAHNPTDDSKIWYKPANGNPNNALLPTCTKILQLGVNTSFSNFSIFGGFRGDDSTASQIYVPANLTSNELTFADCTMKWGYAAVRCGRFIAERCIGDTYLEFGISAYSIDVDDCAFIESANKQFLFVQAFPAPSANASGLAASSITNCYFKMEYTTHGQGLTLYKDSWQNAVVKNNLFYNNVRAFAAQHEEENDRWSGDGLEFVFENNLIYWDSDSVSSYVTGQCTVAMILDDTHIGTASEDHRSYFRHNTVLLDSSLYSVAGTEKDCSIDTQKLGSSKCICESNIAGTIRIIDEPDSWNNTDGQWQYRNAKYGIGGRYDDLTGFAGTDLSMPSASSTLTNVTTNIENGLHIKSGSPWLTAASDGGSIGARFSPMPTPAQLAALADDPIGWSSTYVPQAIPAFEETLLFSPINEENGYFDRVNEDDDFRP